MSSVHARFQLVEEKRIAYHAVGSDGNVAKSEAVSITLSAVKGPPFGPATPQGQLTALIVNDAAASVFRGVPMGTEFDVIISPKGESSDGKEV